MRSNDRVTPRYSQLFPQFLWKAEEALEYTHLRPASPTGDDKVDYPPCDPGAGYPDETRHDRQIQITKVDPRNLPADLRDPDGIRCGYIPSDMAYTVPGLDSPNVPQSSSVYVLDVSTRGPRRREIVKTGPLVGDRENGIDVYSGSHPNSVVVGQQAIYVANGNNDSISILDRRTYEERQRIGLSLLRGFDRTLRGVQPVGLALSPDERYLYVAEAGVNALGVIRLHGMSGRLVGHIPTGWWPSAVRISADGNTLADQTSHLTAPSRPAMRSAPTPSGRRWPETSISPGRMQTKSSWWQQS